jgi:hypothetical protein
MKDNVTDFNKYKEEKKRKSEDEYNKELLINVLTRKKMN